MKTPNTYEVQFVGTLEETWAAYREALRVNNWAMVSSKQEPASQEDFFKLIAGDPTGRVVMSVAFRDLTMAEWIQMTAREESL